jgi:hypothetical protein
MESTDIKEYFRSQRKLLSLFVAFLQENKGFPSVSIGREIPLTKGMRPDLTIIEPKSREILSIIEVKGSGLDFAKNKAIWKQQIMSYLAASGNLSIPTYLVLPPEESSNYSFKILSPDDKHDLIEIAPDDFPSYTTLSAAVISGSIKKAEKKQIEVVDRFHNYSYFLAIFLLLLVIFAILGWWKPTWEILSLIAGAIVLIVLPHLRKLKVFGLEIERLEKSD